MQRILRRICTSPHFLSPRFISCQFSTLKRDESEAALLEALLDSSETLTESNVKGRIRYFDTVSGIAECSGLQQVRVGDLVELEDGTRGLVLSLEERTVKVAILTTGASLSASTICRDAAVQSVDEMYADPQSSDINGLLEEVSGRILNPLGENWPPENVASPVPKDSDRTLQKIVHDAARKWRQWPSNAPSRLSTREVFQRLPTGVPVLDALFPVRRGGSIVISGPPNATLDKSNLACAIAKNHVNGVYDRSFEERMSLLAADKDEGNSKMERPRRCIYVSVGHSASATARTAGSLGLAPKSAFSNENIKGGAEPITFIAAPAPDGLSPPLPLFIRSIAPFVALEIAERAMSCGTSSEDTDGGEDVLVVIDEVGMFVAGAMDVSDTIVTRGPKAAPKSGMQVRDATASASLTRSLCASLLDRAAVLRNGGGSLTLVAVDRTSEGIASETNIVDTSADIVSEALLSLADVSVPLHASSHNAGLVGREILVDWEKVADQPNAFVTFSSLSPCLSSPSPSSSVGHALSMLGATLQRLLRDHIEAKKSAAIAREIGFLVEEEDPEKHEALDRADRALASLANTWTPPVDHGDHRCSNDYEAGIAACLCVLAEFGGAQINSSSELTSIRSKFADVLRQNPTMIKYVEEESEKIAILSTQDLEAATFTAAHIIEKVTGEKVLSYFK